MPATIGSDDPSLGVAGVARQTHHHVLRGLFGQNGHAVVGALPVERRMVPSLRNRLNREVGIFDLGLLKADNVGRVPLEKRQYAFFAGSNRVDVPGGQGELCHSAGFGLLGS